MEKNSQTTRVFNLLSAFIAFAIWGSWAYYINSESSHQSGLLSALTQGSASFAITLFMVHTVTYLFHKFHNPVSQLLLPATIVVSFTTFCLVGVHSFMGTPRVFHTILPASSVAFFFCLYTSYKLSSALLSRSTQHE